MDRLRAPSTYKRIRISEYETALTQGDYISLLDEDIREASSPEFKQALKAARDEKLASMVNGITKPTTFTAYVEYDAANGFGVPIRGFSTCHYTSDNGDKSRASKFNVRVDGQTHTEWLVGRLRDARQP